MGHKAARLGALAAAGFPVPPGLCVTTAAFREALQPHRAAVGAALAAHPRRDPAQAQAAAAAVAGVLRDLALPEGLEAALQAALPPGLRGVPLAVRSSATAEDRADASFAGQYLTVLGSSAADLRAAILRCWQSWFAAGALAARAVAGDGEDGAMAVLVQPLLDAECAGVCYTVDPVAGRRDRLVLSAVWGLGLGAVDGTAAADTVWLRRRGLEVDARHIVDKPERIALEPGTSASRRAPVDPERRHAACLPPAWLRRVAEFALEAERLGGCPQDVEWAIAGQRVHILQARPIAGLPAELARLDPFPVRWSEGADARVSWGLLGAEPQLPLVLDVRAAGADARVDFGRLTGAERLPERRHFAGRAFGRNRPSELGEGDRRIRGAARRDWAAGLRAEGVTPWERLEPVVAGAVRRLAAVDLEAADGPALAAHVEDAFGAFRHHWGLHWVIVGADGDCAAPFRDAVARTTGFGGEELGRECDHLVGGDDTVFTQLIDQLHTLGRTAARDAAAAAVIAAAPADAEAQLRRLPGPVAADCAQRLAQLLALHGERSGAGFGSRADILTPTWREEPALLLRLIAPYLEPGAPDPAQGRERARRLRDARVEALCAAAQDAAAAQEVLRLLPEARRLACDLENHNHYIDALALGQLRRAVRAAARQLVAQGALAEAGDVFCLGRAELVAALRAAPAPDLRPRVAATRADLERWQALTPPPAIGVPDADLEPRPPLQAETAPPQAPEAGGPLRGQAASPGRQRGRARLADPAALLPEVAPGEILVATNAGPQWTPLFPLLGGLVLDEGAMMQHAAAIAREYGVPAVIRASDATRRIPDGAWITVDGGAGTVELERPAAEPAP